MGTRHSRLSLALALALCAAGSAADNNPVDEKWWPSEFGADDQAGATNTITPEKRVAAATLVRKGEVATLDYSHSAGPQFSVGRSATLAELALQGLRETSEKTLAAGALNCPHCGASLELKLAASQALSCHQCQALIDVSQGPGGQLRSTLQALSLIHI